MFNGTEALDYFKRLPAYNAYKDKNDNELISKLFDAYEDINSLYPSVEVSNRMIVKQMLFKDESDKSGFGISQRHGLSSRKINDASVTFSGTYNMFDPYVWQIIQAQMGEGKLPAGFGRLV